MTIHEPGTQVPCPPGGVLWTDGTCVPAGLVGAPATWLMDVALPVAAVVFLAVMVVACVRRRSLTWWMLLSLASASVFWLEAFGDWGQHLMFSPEFAHYTLDWKWAGRHNPYWMPLMYAVYWVAHAWAILRLAQWLQRKRPGMSLGMAILILSAPVTWVWNLVIEGVAAYLGWWTYEPPIGPFFDLGRGNWPLLWPALVVWGWINLMAWMVGPPEEENRLNRLERLFRLDRLLVRPGWSRAPIGQRTSAIAKHGQVAVVDSRTAVGSVAIDELDPTMGAVRFQFVRLCAWIIFSQITFAFFGAVIIGVRLIFGFDSAFQP